MNTFTLLACISKMLLLLILYLFYDTTVGISELNGVELSNITNSLEHGECPHWDEDKQVLYFVDIHQGKLYGYDYNTKNINYIQLNGTVAPVTPSQKDPDELIVGVNKSIVKINWDGKNQLKSQKVLSNLQDSDQCRLNDGKADKEGRLWYGTMGEDASGFIPGMGALHKITTNNLQNPRRMIGPVDISNGLAWNSNNDKFYYIDSKTFQVVEYDYDNTKGEISNKRIIIDVRDFNLNFEPDGMTIDINNNLWIALYGGGMVIKVNTTSGKISGKVSLPVKFITSVAFGGPNLDILYATTSRYSLTEEEKLKQPVAGSVFSITNTGSKGFPMNKANV